MKETNRQFDIQMALYKSGRHELFYKDVDELMRGRYGNVKHVTKYEFMDAIREFAGYADYHLFIGGRKSENPGVILYGNLHRPRNKDR